MAWLWDGFGLLSRIDAARWFGFGGSVLFIPMATRWDTIELRIRNLTRFFRSYSPYEMLYVQFASFSQFGEDCVLEKCFFSKQATGFYVDIGAFHPFAGSNTYSFYRRGWRGINVEPNPLTYWRFPKYRKRDVNLNLAVSTVEGDVEFSADSVFSGIRDNDYVSQNPHSRPEIITVKAVRLSTLLDCHLPAETTIDFMSVDCEGHDLKVLQSNDWNRFRPRLILAEDLSMETGTALDVYLAGIGYRFVVSAELSKFYWDGQSGL